MRTYIKGGSKMLKIVKQNKEVNENNENEEEMKMKWSLKKKLLVGAAAGVAGVVSIIAYGKSKQSDSVECDMDEEDDDDNEQFLDNEEQDRQAELGNDETTEQ